MGWSAVPWSRIWRHAACWLNALLLTPAASNSGTHLQPRSLDVELGDARLVSQDVAVQPATGGRR